MPRSRAPLSVPRFLLDRSVGRYIIAEGMQNDGFEVETLASLYGEPRVQAVKDEEWLQAAGADNLVVITADSAIRRRPSEIAAVEQYGVKMFCIANGHLTGPAQLAIVRQHILTVPSSSSSTNRTSWDPAVPEPGAWGRVAVDLAAAWFVVHVATRSGSHPGGPRQHRVGQRRPARQ